MLSAICSNLDQSIILSYGNGLNLDSKDDIGKIFRNLPVSSYKAKGYQILHVALSSGPVLNLPNCQKSQYLHGLI